MIYLGTLFNITLNNNNWTLANFALQNKEQKAKSKLVIVLENSF